MKLIEVILTANRLNEFVKKDKELPFELARAITKNGKILSNECEIYENERQKFMSNIESMTEEEKQKADTRLKEMLDTDIEIDIQKVSMDKMQAYANENRIVLSAKDFLALDFMISE